MNQIYKDKNIIAYILKYSGRIRETVNYFGRKFEIFESNSIYRDACIMNLLQISNVARRLSDEFRAEHPNMQWDAIDSIQHLISHSYFSLNVSDTWETITNDLPKLEEYCTNVLNESV